MTNDLSEVGVENLLYKSFWLNLCWERKIDTSNNQENDSESKLRAKEAKYSAYKATTTADDIKCENDTSSPCRINWRVARTWRS